MSTETWIANDRGLHLRPGGVAGLVHATWISDDHWFYECPSCECDFGPLVDRATAEADARDHDWQWHNGQRGDGETP